MARARISITHPARLVSIHVDDDRSLRIVLQEQTGLRPEVGEGFGLGGRDIISGPDDGTYELHWNVVVCFAVRGDPFPKGEPSLSTLSEAGESSPFLQWVRSSSYADPDYIAGMQPQLNAPALPLRHWRVSSIEALIDVAATNPPAVRRL